MNVLLLIADSVRAQNTSLYGYERDTTPFLNKLSSESIVYKHAIAPSTWSLPSHASILTGLHAEEHQLFGSNESYKSNAHIWNYLSKKGYNIGVFSSNPFITEPQYGFTNGVDQIVSNIDRFDYPFDAPSPTTINTRMTDLPPLIEYLTNAISGDKPIRTILNGASTFLTEKGLAPEAIKRTHQNRANEYASRLLEWISSVTGDWAGCINFMTTHFDYHPLDKYDYWGTDSSWNIQDSINDQRWPFYRGDRTWSEKEQLVNLYDGTIRQVDATIHRIFESLKQSGQLEDTLLIVTADHGETFGEKSEIHPSLRLAGHSFGIHDALLHVPLLIYNPNISNDVIENPVSLTGLYYILQEVANNSFDPSTIQRTECVSAVDIDARLMYDSQGNKLEPEEYGIDPKKSLGVARAGYKMTADGIKKHSEWGDNKLETNIRKEIESTWQNIKIKDVKSTVSIEDGVEERLENLGYK